MRFFGDTQDHKLCSHELIEQLKLELDEQKRLLESYD